MFIVILLSKFASSVGATCELAHVAPTELVFVFTDLSINISLLRS